MKGDRLGEFEELTLLAVRALGDKTYAVPVQQFIEDETHRPAVMGAVYASLERLERKGFLKSSMGDATPERGGKRKRLYAVTPVGMQTLKRRATTPATRSGERSRKDDVRERDTAAASRAAAASRWCPLGDRRQEVAADLREAFLRRAESHGRRAARRGYYRDVISVLADTPSPNRLRRPRPSRWPADAAADLGYAIRVFRRQPGAVGVAGGRPGAGDCRRHVGVQPGLRDRAAAVRHDRSGSRLSRQPHLRAGDVDLVDATGSSSGCARRRRSSI